MPLVRWPNSARKASTRCDVRTKCSGWGSGADRDLAVEARRVGNASIYDGFPAWSRRRSLPRPLRVGGRRDPVCGRRLVLSLPGGPDRRGRVKGMARHGRSSRERGSFCNSERARGNDLFAVIWNNAHCEPGAARITRRRSAQPRSRRPGRAGNRRRRRSS